MVLTGPYVLPVAEQRGSKHSSKDKALATTSDLASSFLNVSKVLGGTSFLYSPLLRKGMILSLHPLSSARYPSN